MSTRDPKETTIIWMRELPRITDSRYNISRKNELVNKTFHTLVWSNLKSLVVCDNQQTFSRSAAVCNVVTSKTSCPFYLNELVAGPTPSHRHNDHFTDQYASHRICTECKWGNALGISTSSWKICGFPPFTLRKLLNGCRNSSPVINSRYSLEEQFIARLPILQLLSIFSIVHLWKILEGYRPRL